MEVELSMSNIGSPERVDQVKPLKHSAEKRMIPDLMYSGKRNIIYIIYLYYVLSKQNYLIPRKVLKSICLPRAKMTFSTGNISIR